MLYEVITCFDLNCDVEMLQFAPYCVITSYSIHYTKLYDLCLCQPNHLHNRIEIEKHPMFKRITMIEGSSIAQEIVTQVV